MTLYCILWAVITYMLKFSGKGGPVGLHCKSVGYRSIVRRWEITCHICNFMNNNNLQTGYHYSKNCHDHRKKHAALHSFSVLADSASSPIKFQTFFRNRCGRSIQLKMADSNKYTTNINEFNSLKFFDGWSDM